METAELKERTEAAPYRRLHNFSAGPGTLPEEVLLEVRDELPVYGDVGASVMEISHRSPAYSGIAENARVLLRKLLHLSDDWHILFLQSGGTSASGST